MNKFLLSVVIPVYNEQDNIEPLLSRLLPIIEPYNYELIFVNDGSKDGTVENIKKVAEKNKRLKLISFNRNFGHQMALSAGYDHAKGDCVITLDSDLQDPPEIIPQMIELWQSGSKIVYAKRAKREVDNWFKKHTALFFYKLINYLSETDIPQDVGDFRLIDRVVVDFLKDLTEHSRFLRGLVAWGGYPATYVEFDRAQRHSGETHYPLSKMVNFAMEGITSLSTKPLRIAIYMGFFVSAFSILMILFKIIQNFVFHAGDWLPGWASLFFSTVFLGGVQLVTIGIIGEYIGKIYKEVQRRPLYIIKEKVNL